jgi:hypothetical protein
VGYFPSPPPATHFEVQVINPRDIIEENDRSTFALQTDSGRFWLSQHCNSEPKQKLTIVLDRKLILS